MGSNLAQPSRYSRHEVLPEIGSAGQNKLRNARVLCIGAGGLGSPVISYLAAAGIGTLGIVDYDRVDRSNLQRQIIHSESTLGELKTDSAFQYISRLNPDVKINLYSVRLSEYNAIDISKDYDLIIDGSDNFSTRYLVSDVGNILDIPVIWGSVFKFYGQVSIFHPKIGPCYRCVFPQPPAPGSVPNCSTVGVMGAVCGTIGSIMATEAIKVIVGMPNTLISTILIYSAEDSNFERIKISKNVKCYSCSKPLEARTLLPSYQDFCGEVIGITVHDFETKRSINPNLVILDVRRPEEYESGNIPGSINIPSDDFLNQLLILDLDRDVELVIYCHSGARSRKCIREIEQLGLTNVSNLDGGILAWNSIVGV